MVVLAVAPHVHANVVACASHTGMPSWNETSATNALCRDRDRLAKRASAAAMKHDWND